MLNKVVTHTNANPVLSSSKAGTVYSNLGWGKNVIFLRLRAGRRHKQRSIPVAGQKHMERNRGRVYQRREKSESSRIKK